MLWTISDIKKRDEKINRLTARVKELENLIRVLEKNPDFDIEAALSVVAEEQA